MGRLMGSYAEENELDRPDLNKCPDCGCFFPGDNCPLCGKECPENMRAGNRAAVKKKKKSSGYTRTRFVEWYHSWWFIILMLIVFPLAGIPLLITSPHKKWLKITLSILAIAVMVLPYANIGRIISGVAGLFDNPVNTSLSRSEYISACEETDAEDFYRNAESYKGRYVTVTLRIISAAEFAEDYYDENKYYLCEDSDGSEFYIIIRDCIQDGAQNFINGDTVKIYGEYGGEKSVYCVNNDTYAAYTAPSINTAYADVIKDN